MSKYYRVLSPRRRLRSWRGLLLLIAFAAVFGFPRDARAQQVTAPSVSTGSFTVSWTASSGGQNRAYLLEQSASGSFRYSVTGAQSRTFTRSPGIFTYRLQLCFFEAELNRELCEPPGPEVTVVVTTGTVPATPGNLTAAPARSTGTFSLAWTAVAGSVDHYNVEERVGATGAFSVIAQPAASPLALNRSDGQRFYRVRACTTAVCGGFSNTVEVVVLRVPGVPGTLGPDTTTGTSYVIGWGAASGTVARFELEETVGSTGARTTFRTTARSRAFRDREEDTYRYRVRACNDSGCGPFTAAKVVTVSPPPNIVGPAMSEGPIALSWSLPSPAENIAHLETRRPGGNWATLLKAPGRVSISMFRTCAACEGVYEFRLRFCERGEPGATGDICGEPGRIHRVTVDHPANQVLTPAAVPACSDAQRAVWEAAVLSSQGVLGRDPAGEAIGPEPERKTIVIPFDNWFPVDGNKHTLCGLVHRFEVFDGLGDEVDFNHYLIPNAQHGHILQNAILTSTINFDDSGTELDGEFTFIQNEIHDCAGENDCLEVEVTPHAGFWRNPWFWRDRNWPAGGHSTFIAREACVYGPWVWEWAHDDRPEIHPSELYWWRSRALVPPGVDLDVFRLVTIQDDSGRFDRWAKGPLDAEFRIAFEVDVNGPPKTFDVLEEADWKRQVVTTQDAFALWDADDGTSHALDFGVGNTVLEVNERQSADDDIGVRFADICRDSDRLLGYIAVRTKVGLSFAGSEGFHVIRVERPHEAVPGLEIGPPGPAPDDEPDLSGQLARTRMVRRSLHRATALGRPSLVMDLEVGPPAGVAQAGRNPAVTRATLVVRNQRWPIRVGGRGPEGGTLLLDVPVPIRDEAVLEVQFESGETLRNPLPRIALAPAVAAATPAETAASAAAWQVMLKAAGGRPDLPAPFTPLLEVRRWDLQLSTGYAAVRNGQVSAEEGTPAVEQLNDALRRGGDESLALFGVQTPVKTVWSFTAINRTTGVRVPVVVGAPARPNEVRVEIPASTVPGEKVTIWFPTQPQGHLYEVVATAKSLDVFGTRGEMQHRVWNYAVAGRTVDSLAQALFVPLATQAGRQASELLMMTALPRGAEVGDPGEAERRQARVLWLRALHAAADRQITVDELGVLIGLADRIRTR